MERITLTLLSAVWVSCGDVGVQERSQHCWEHLFIYYFHPSSVQNNIWVVACVSAVVHREYPGGLSHGVLLFNNAGGVGRGGAVGR